MVPRIVRVGVPDLMRTDPLHDTTILPPVLRQVPHAVLTAVVDGARPPRAPLRVMYGDKHLPRVLQVVPRTTRAASSIRAISLCHVRKPTHSRALFGVLVQVKSPLSLS